MAKALLRSFARGIITPEMYGRIDLTAFQTGLGDALNFITLPHGPAARRPGAAAGPLDRRRDRGPFSTGTEHLYGMH